MYNITYIASFSLISEILHNENRIFSTGNECGRGVGVSSGRQISSPGIPAIAQVINCILMELQHAIPTTFINRIPSGPGNLHFCLVL